MGIKGGAGKAGERTPRTPFFWLFGQAQGGAGAAALPSFAQHVTIEEMQGVLDAYFIDENPTRLHQGRGMGGRTPIKAFISSFLSATSRQEATSAKNRRPTSTPAAVPVK